MVHPPVEFPSDAARVIIRLYRGGQILTEKAAFGEAVWNLLGYMEVTTLGVNGQPPAPVVQETPHSVWHLFGSTNAPPTEETHTEYTDEQVIATLEAHEAAPARDKFSQFSPLPTMLLVKWCIKILIDLMS